MGLKHSWGRVLRTNALVLGVGHIQVLESEGEVLSRRNLKGAGGDRIWSLGMSVLRAARGVPFPTGPTP